MYALGYFRSLLFAQEMIFGRFGGGYQASRDKSTMVVLVLVLVLVLLLLLWILGWWC
jgi:hypothetical protein